MLLPPCWFYPQDQFSRPTAIFV
ncbi:unnamed protein product [Clonostachys rosea f. rosea IK726]|uniref:Uncharacterized protein n=1 Tax=Clonostachys rosea f. rosea IK726 TaxID=1349383 RepID=A0ACA9UE68_BIOOC|nr:unnamed protein product [Clonostachys rosea f. rosea IK726]